MPIATGGTILYTTDTYSRPIEVHVFTESGNLVLSEGFGPDFIVETLVDYYVVGGGAGGGTSNLTNGAAGGGGAGEVRPSVNTAFDYVSLTAGSHPVIVGTGGTAALTATETGQPGTQSSFNGTIALGGLGGGSTGSLTGAGSTILLPPGGGGGAIASNDTGGIIGEGGGGGYRGTSIVSETPAAIGGGGAGSIIQATPIAEDQPSLAVGGTGTLFGFGTLNGYNDLINSTEGSDPVGFAFGGNGGYGLPLTEDGSYLELLGTGTGYRGTGAGKGAILNDSPTGATVGLPNSGSGGGGGVSNGDLGAGAAGANGVVVIALVNVPAGTTTTPAPTTTTTTHAPTTTTTTTHAPTTTTTTTTPAPDTYTLTMACVLPGTTTTTTPSPVSGQENIPRARTVYTLQPIGNLLPPPTGDSILILGCALDGPNDRVVDATSLVSLEGLFGPLTYNSDYLSPNDDPEGSYSGNSLLKAIYEAQAGGATNIQLLRVGGNTAAGASLSGLVTVQAQYAGEIYNGASLTLSTVGSYLQVVATQPKLKGKTFSSLYALSMSLQAFCTAFNGDPHNNTFLLETENGGLAVSTLASGMTTLASGTYGTLLDDFSGDTKAPYLEAVRKQLPLLDDSPYTILYIPDIYADDDIGEGPNGSFVTELADFCYWRSQNTSPCHGIIGVQPLQDPSRPAIQAQVLALITPSSDTYSINSFNPNRVNIAQYLSEGLLNTIGADSGAYLSIVVGPDLIFSNSSFAPYTETGAGFYAGLVSQLSPLIAATHQSLPVGVGLAWELTQSQLNLLNGGIGFVTEASQTNLQQGGGAYVTFRTNQESNGYVVTEDVTAAKRTSAYRNLQTLRITQMIESAVQTVAEKYLGKTNTTTTVSALDSDLQATLDLFSSRGILQGYQGTGYNYSLGSTIVGSYISTIQITLWIKPFGQIHRIDSLLSVSQN